MSRSWSQVATGGGAPPSLAGGTVRMGMSGTSAAAALLSDAPALPGTSDATSTPTTSSSAARGVAPGKAGKTPTTKGAGGGVQRNAWTGELAPEAAAAAKEVQVAPTLPVGPAGSGGVVGSALNGNNANNTPVVTTPPPPTTDAATPQPQSAGGRGAARGRGGPGERGGRGGGRGGGHQGSAPTSAPGTLLPAIEIAEGRDPAADILSVEKVRSSLQPAEEKSISKKLALVLRHDALAKGLSMTRNGFVAVDELLRHPLFSQVKPGQIAKVCQDNEKQRYKLAYAKATGQLVVRANQGHSISDVVVDMRRLADPNEVPVAIHGTQLRVWPTILAQGLNRMGRQHVHMAVDVPGSTKVVSGARSTSNCLIYVDVAMMVRDGIEVFVSENGVILTAGLNGVVPPVYFIKMCDGGGAVQWSQAE